MEQFTEMAVNLMSAWGLRIGLAIAVVLSFWIVSNIASGAIYRIGKSADVHARITFLLARTAKISLIIFGIVSALGTLGINVMALVAGLGLTGFALGFAFKDIISNLLAGILLIIYQPFTLDDYINVSGFEGIVKSIDLRYTVLEGKNMTILIPNSKLFTDPITVTRAAPQEQKGE